MAIIAIGAGHGINTAGKRTPDDEREWSFNSYVVESTIKQLEAYGHKVIRLDDPTGKTDVPLSTRTNKANNANADILISYHHNAYLGRWAGHTGTETYIYNNASANSLKLAEAVHPQVVNAYGLSNRGIKRANFHMVRESTMPAILIEGGYMDSIIDIQKMRDKKVLAAAGKAVAEGVNKYFGVSGKVSAPKTEVKSSTTSKPESISISQMASEVIAGKHGSGHANRRKSLGISQAEYEKVRAEVNRRAGVTSTPKPSKSIAQMAQEVIDGKHGNGHDTRRKSLSISQSEYNKVRAEVNKRAGVSVNNKKSVKQMADEIIDGKHPNGHETRRKSLGISKTEYAKVRAEVNRRL